MDNDTQSPLDRNPARKWTTEEDQILLSHYFSHQRTEIATILNRSEGSIRKRCSVLGLNSKHPAISQESLDTIRAWYLEREDMSKGDFDLPSLAKSLNMLESNVAREARRMGLTRCRRTHSLSMRQDQSTRSKSWFEHNEHPKGFLGHTHGSQARSKISKSSNHYWKSITPIEREMRKSKRNSTMLIRYGTGNPSMKGQNAYSRTKSGKRADLNGLYVRSGWEANYARYLNLMVSQGIIVSWAYEPKTFVFTGITRGVLTYTPDFRVTLPDQSIEWHEVKGWMDAKSKAKLKRFAKFYPDEKLILIDQKAYAQLAKFRPLIEGWEI